MIELKKEELELLSKPQLFYDYSKLSYNLNNSDPIDFKGLNNSKIRNISIITEYKPCFSIFEKIYRNNSARLINCPLFLAELKDKSCVYSFGDRKNINRKNSGKPCLILIHGFKSKNKKIYLQMAERYARRGIDCLVYFLPFHFERNYIDNKGINFLDWQDFRVTLELFRQTIIETRLLLKVLRQIGYDHLGCLGFSFGGYCCSILGCFEKNVDFIIPMASIGNFESLMLIKKEKIRDLRNSNKKSSKYGNPVYLPYNQDPTDLIFEDIVKFNKFLARNFMKLINPVSYKPVISLKKILFIQGLFDHRAPLFDFFKFRREWGNPQVIFYPCDHFTFFLFNHITIKTTENFIKTLCNKLTQ